MVILRLFSVLLLLLLSDYVAAQPQLKLILDSSEVQLGRSINAELYAIGSRQKISTINLTPLQNDFAFSIEETAEAIDDPRWPKQAVQMLQLKLYPRKTGNLSIPALSLDDLKNKPQTILVHKPIKKSRSGNSNIERTLTVSSTQPWERQQTIIDVTIPIADAFVSPQTEELKIPGFEVFKLPTKTDISNHAGKKYAALHLRWALFPLVAGQYRVDLPAIQLRKSGRIIGTHYFPLQQLTVKALPPYIPPTLPVGKITIASALSSQSLLFPNDLNFWDVTLQGYGVPPNWMPPVLRQIQANSDIDFLPSHAQQQRSSNNRGLQITTTHHIPFKAKANGRLGLPDLRVQYFDPASGKIVTLRHQPQDALVFGLSSRIFFGVGFFLMSLWLTNIFYRKLSTIWSRAQLRKMAFSKLRAANNATEIRHALQMLSNAEGWSKNMTLRDWARCWRSCFRVNEDFMSVIDQLSQASYGKSTLELATIREKLLIQLK